MRLLLSSLRANGFGVTLPLACVLGVGGRLISHDAAQVPTIRVAIPPATLVPVVAVLLLSWTLGDRWPEVTAIADRNAGLIASVRLALTAVVCAVPSLIGAGRWGTALPVAVTLVGVGLASLARWLAGERVWMLVLAGGFCWLHHAATVPADATLPYATPLAALVLTAAALLHLVPIRFLPTNWSRSLRGRR